MANKLDNLKKGKATQFKAGEEQAKIASEGGKKSAAARRTNADIRKMLNAALFEEYTDKTGKKIEGIQGIVNALIVKSLNGKDKDQLAAIKYIFNLLGLDKSEIEEDKLKEEIELIRAKVKVITSGQGSSAVDDDIRKQIDDIVKDIKPIEESENGDTETDN